MSAADIIVLVVSGGSFVVAMWAAYTAHKARAWQEQRDKERRATNVALEFIHEIGPDPFYNEWAGDQPKNVYTVTLLVRNDGESTEYLTAAFLQQPTAQPRGLRIYGSEGSGGDPPHELRPRANQRISVQLDTESREWMRPGFVAIVWLGSGERVYSDVEHLVDSLLDDVG
jgi:hypothetical protein